MQTSWYLIAYTLESRTHGPIVYRKKKKAYLLPTTKRQISKRFYIKKEQFYMFMLKQSRMIYDDNDNDNDNDNRRTEVGRIISKLW